MTKAIREQSRLRQSRNIIPQARGVRNLPVASRGFAMICAQHTASLELKHAALRLREIVFADPTGDCSPFAAYHLSPHALPAVSSVPTPASSTAQAMGDVSMQPTKWTIYEGPVRAVG